MTATSGFEAMYAWAAGKKAAIAMARLIQRVFDRYVGFCGISFSFPGTEGYSYLRLDEDASLFAQGLVLHSRKS